MDNFCLKFHRGPFPNSSSSYLLLISISLSSCLSLVTTTSTILNNSASLFVLSLQILFHAFDFFHNNSHCVHLGGDFGLEMSRVSFELCPPSHPAGCCHRDIVLPCHALPCHLSRLSVMVRFKTAVVFLIFESLLLFYEKNTRTKESDDCSHSSLLSSLSSSSTEGKGSKLTLFIHPSISLFTLHFSVRSVQDRSHRCQRERSRCVLSSKRPRYCTRNRHVDNLVVLFRFQV